MRGQQNIVVTIVLVVLVLGLLAYTGTWFQSQTKRTVNEANETWDGLIGELKST